MDDIVLPWTKSIQYENDLSAEDQLLRDEVVREYMYDRNWTNACKRLGMNSQMAMEYASRFATDSYCKWKIRQEEEKLALRNPDSKKTEEALERERVISALKEEAYYHGPGASHAARVSALKQLSVIYGMEAPKQVKTEVGVQSGVMLVPVVGATSDWESAAKQAQETLQQETLDGLSPLH